MPTDERIPCSEEPGDHLLLSDGVRNTVRGPVVVATIFERMMVTEHGESEGHTVVMDRPGMTRLRDWCDAWFRENEP